ncbi:hypothetical protein KY345_02580 [Candidatus Woesearchaeota archaeon]|nr:hypothetical protein [Candidatus Woesearchaeota archaeon]
MKLNIKNQKENPVLKRTEIEAELVFTGPTPSKETVKNEIASQTKADAELVEVKEIKTDFGNQSGKALIYVYQDAESKKEMVKLNKKQIEKEQKTKAEAAPKEEKKEEAPAKEEAKAEKKEEKPAEEKKEEPKPEGK